MKRSTTLAVRVTAVAAVVSLAASCGAGGRDEATETTEGSTVGISDTSVKIGAHFPLTGVAAPGYSEIPTGAKAYFDYVNAADPETLEPLTLYRALYGERGLWVRPAAMFMEEVVVNGIQQPRFAKVTETDASQAGHD